MTEKEQVRKFAKRKGYFKAEFVADLEKYRCYNPVYRNEVKYNTGLPDFILVNKENGEIRLTDGNETMEIYHKLYPPG